MQYLVFNEKSVFICEKNLKSVDNTNVSSTILENEVNQ